MADEIINNQTVDNVSNNLYLGVTNIIDHARQEVVVYVNKHANMMFWHIGQYINEDMGYKSILPMAARFLRHCRKD